MDDAVKTGENKEREIFAAAVVKDGEVISTGVKRESPTPRCSSNQEPLEAVADFVCSTRADEP